MAEIYNSYLQQRMLDLALGRKKTKTQFVNVLPDAVVTCIEGCASQYDVKSAGGDVTYTVDLSVGICTCPAGNTGAVCKHQTACAQYSSCQLPLYTLLHQRNEGYLDSSTPDMEFFADLGKEDRIEPGQGGLGDKDMDMDNMDMDKDKKDKGMDKHMEMDNVVSSTVEDVIDIASIELAMKGFKENIIKENSAEVKKSFFNF
jgi:hypothetical protein